MNNYNQKKTIIILMTFLSIIIVCSTFSFALKQTESYKIANKNYFKDWVKNEDVISIDNINFIFYTEEETIVIQELDENNNSIYSKLLVPDIINQYDTMYIEILDYNNIYGNRTVHSNVNPHEYKLNIYTEKLEISVTREHPEDINIYEDFNFTIKVTNSGSKKIKDIEYKETLPPTILVNKDIGIKLEQDDSMENVPSVQKNNKIFWKLNLDSEETKTLIIPAKIIGARIGEDNIYSNKGYLEFNTSLKTQKIVLNNSLLSTIKSAKNHFKINNISFIENNTNMKYIPLNSTKNNNINLTISNPYDEKLLISGAIKVPKGLMFYKADNNNIKNDRYYFSFNLNEYENKTINFESIIYDFVNGTLELKTETSFIINKGINISKEIKIPVLTNENEIKKKTTLKLANINNWTLNNIINKIENNNKELVILPQNQVENENEKLLLINENINKTKDSNISNTSIIESNNNNTETNNSSLGGLNSVKIRDDNHLKEELSEFEGETLMSLTLDKIIKNTDVRSVILVCIILIITIILIRVTINLSKRKFNLNRNKISYETNTVVEKEEDKPDTLTVDNSIEEMVNLGLHEVPNPKELNLNALKMYIDYQISNGKTKEFIYKKLLENGWNESIISGYIDIKKLNKE